VATDRQQQVKDLIYQALVPFKVDLASHRVLFFGSRVAGTAGPRSDFDVAVDGLCPVEPRLFARIGSVLDELPTLYRIDLVDLTSVPSAVRSEMLKHTERIL
jgi:predicted nucleotidyltransferase